MRFYEKKVKTGYEYEVHDVFGHIQMQSALKLDGSVLDRVVVALMQVKSKAEKLTGEIPYEDTKIEYTFSKAPIWEDDDEEVLTMLQRISRYFNRLTLRYKMLKEAWTKTI